MAYDAEFSRHLTVDPLSITEPRERLLYLRDFLRNLPPERFNMRSWWSAVTGGGLKLYGTRPEEFTAECGTAACVAGWTVSVFRPRSPLNEFRGDWVEDVAGLILGLSSDEADKLFFPPDFFSERTDEWTPAQAADVIDHLLATGKVDWSVAQPRPSEAATTVQPIRDEVK